jgi:hypothetical protein
MSMRVVVPGVKGATERRASTMLANVAAILGWYFVVLINLNSDSMCGLPLDTCGREAVNGSWLPQDRRALTQRALTSCNGRDRHGW